MKQLLALVVVGSLWVGWGGIAVAQDKGNVLLDLLIKKGMITQEEAAQVKTDWDKQLATAIEKQDKTKVAGWIDSMKWYGDLRLRAEFGLGMTMRAWATIGLRLAKF